MAAETMSDLRTAKEETEGQSITLGPQTAPVPFFPLKRSRAWNVSAHMMNGDGRFTEMANHLNLKSKNSPLVTVSFWREFAPALPSRSADYQTSS